MLEKLKNAFLQNWNVFIKHIPDFVLAIFIIAAGFFLAKFITKLFRKAITKKIDDPLMTNFLSKTVKALLLILIIMFALNTAGLSGIASGILAAAGASALILGFAFKDIGENFLAGIILAFSRPFHINDTVQIENVFGKVKAMEFRYTKITTFDGRNVYIPNSDVLTKPVFNFTEDGFYRSDFIVGIAYENNIHKAKEIILTCLDEEGDVVKDTSHINFVAEDELAASTVNLKVYFWVTTDDFRRSVLETKGRLIKSVKTRLEAAGFNLPANITEVKFYDTSKSFSVQLADAPAPTKE